MQCVTGYRRMSRAIVPMERAWLIALRIGNRLWTGQILLSSAGILSMRISSPTTLGKATRSLEPTRSPPSSSSIGRRGKSQESVGIETLPYAVVGSAEEGVDYITREGKPFVMKPWGGTADKAMTHVASTPDEAVFILEKWEREGKFT